MALRANAARRGTTTISRVVVRLGLPRARLHHSSTVQRQVPAIMTRQRVGLWLVGAFGGVGTTITLGLTAMARGLADRTGLVSELHFLQACHCPSPGIS